MSFCISRADFKRFGCIMIDVIVHVEKNLISIYNTQGAKIFVFLRETNNSHFCCSAQNRGGGRLQPPSFPGPDVTLIGLLYTGK
jgi:RecJ-like exonuclease